MATDSILNALRVLIGTDLSSRLKDITHPTLLLHPDGSPFIPVPVMAELHRLLPDAELNVIGHSPPWFAIFPCHLVRIVVAGFSRPQRLKGRPWDGCWPVSRRWRSGCLATPGLAQEKLTIWWAKGFYKAEDDALLAVVKKYEAKTGVKVELSWHAAQEMIPKVTAALDAGTPPDIAYADAFNLQTAGRWAFEGKLEDISDVIAPIKDRFAPNTAEATWLANGKTGKRAYYAFPLKQQTLHIQYWKDILAAAGFKENDIPYTWKEYWAFWCDKVQPAFGRRPAPPCSGRQPDGHRVDRTPTSRSLPGSTPTTSSWSMTRARSWSATPRCEQGLMARSRTIPTSTRGLTPPTR